MESWLIVTIAIVSAVAVLLRLAVAARYCIDERRAKAEIQAQTEHVPHKFDPAKYHNRKTSLLEQGWQELEPGVFVYPEYGESSRPSES